MRTCTKVTVQLLEQGFATLQSDNKGLPWVFESDPQEYLLYYFVLLSRLERKQTLERRKGTDKLEGQCTQ